MNSIRIEASAPSNIALIKYMGKSSQAENRPANASLSYSLENLRTFVVIEPSSTSDNWQPLPGFEKMLLSEKGEKKFMNHFVRLKEHWGIAGHFNVFSANNFPSDCGLASSASSFAALTLAGFKLAQSQKPGLQCLPEELSRISRLGSGSSSRSMFSPWSEWRGEGAMACEIPIELDHAVILVDDSKKLVSSSEAHARVSSSLLWAGRPERAEKRLASLKGALSATLGKATSTTQSGESWVEAFEICWAEFWDMHALFETSQPSFGFMTEGTLRVLTHVRALWALKKDGPLVTMDAGANVHLLFRKDQTSKDEWISGYRAIRSWT